MLRKSSPTGRIKFVPTAFFLMPCCFGVLLHALAKRDSLQVVYFDSSRGTALKTLKVDS